MKLAPVLFLSLCAGCAAHEQALGLERDAKALRGQLARLYVDRGAYAAAVPLVQAELRENPDDVEMLTLSGVVLRESGLYPQAQAQLEKVVARAPQHAPAHAALARLFDLQKRFDAGEVEHRKALALSPQDAGEWNNLGFSLYVQGRDVEAIAALEKALALSPGLVVAYNNLGFAYARHRELAAARRCFLTVGGERTAKVNLELASSFTRSLE